MGILLISIQSKTIDVYLNGIYIGFFNYNPEVDSFSYLRFYIGTIGSLDSDYNVNIDNFTVATFGNGNGEYSGAISEAARNSSINLTECADSVLFNKNN